MTAQYVEGSTPAERSAFERQRQGLPVTVTDPVALLETRRILDRLPKKEFVDSDPTPPRGIPRPALLVEPCPHCFVSVDLRNRDRHLRFECTALGREGVS